MKKVGVIADNSCGISAEEAKKLGIKLVYIPFIIEDEEFSEDKNLTRELFFNKLDTASSLSTSQPSIEVVKSVWDEALKEYDEIVYLPLSSGLSSTCESCKNASLEYNGKVEVVNNKRVSVTLKLSVYEAVELAKRGKSAFEIRQTLESEGVNSSIYIMVPTLKYLKKGGRITATAAAIGQILSIKPILQIQGDKLDSYAKTLTIKQAKSKMIGAIKKDLDTRFCRPPKNKQVVISLAHSCNNLDELESFKKEVQAEFPNYPILFADHLPLCICCHIGQGSLAITCTLVENEVVEQLKQNS